MVLVITFLTLVMAVSGLLLKYTFFATKYLKFLDLGLVRYIHNSLSPFFTAVLALMAVSGLYMYFYLLAQQRKAARSQDEQDQE